MTKRWVIVIASEQVVWVVNQPWRVGVCLWELRWPYSLISIFSLMHSEIWRPNSVMNNSLSKVPFLEVVSSVFLMSWMNFWSEDHFAHKFSLLETLINKQVIFLMHSSMTTLAWPLEYFKSSPQSKDISIKAKEITLLNCKCSKSLQMASGNDHGAFLLNLLALHNP